MPSRPTVSEMRAPWRMRERTSRPRRSVPSRWKVPPSAGADEVQVAVPAAPEAVGVAAAEEAERLHLGGVGHVVPLQVLHVELLGVAVDERADEEPSWKRWIACGGA
jgi:hypothetical protein